MRFDRGARVLYHAPVWNAGRASRFAPATCQAEANMLYVGLCYRGARGHLRHLVDTAAGRIHLDAEHAIGGARVQAQAAMHAPVQIRLEGLIGCDLKYGCRVGHD